MIVHFVDLALEVRIEWGERALDGVGEPEAADEGRVDRLSELLVIEQAGAGRLVEVEVFDVSPAWGHCLLVHQLAGGGVVGVSDVQDRNLVDGVLNLHGLQEPS